MLLCAIAGVLLGLGAYRIIPSLDLLQATTPASQLPDNGPQQPVRVRFSKHSYNEGIMKVAPSVVSLYSSETIYKAPVRGFQGDEQVPVIAPVSYTHLTLPTILLV